DLAGDGVGVDHDRPPLGQQRCDGRLPRPDAAREPHHLRHLPGLSVPLCKSGLRVRFHLPRTGWGSASPMSSTISRSNPPEGFGRLAAALASSAETTRLETRLVYLTVAARVITVLAGVLFGLAHPPSGDGFAISAAVLVVWTLFATLYQLRSG